MIKWKTVKRLIMTISHEQMACERSYKSRCTFGKIIPSEAALKQYSLRASLQIQIWTASHVAKPHIPSPLEYRWQKWKDSLQQVCFEGPMSTDFLKDIVCSCKGKSPCKICTCLLGGKPCIYRVMLLPIRVITKLPNSEQSYKGKVKTHNYINGQNQSDKKGENHDSTNMHKRIHWERTQVR